MAIAKCREASRVDVPPVNRILTSRSGLSQEIGTPSGSIENSAARGSIMKVPTNERQEEQSGRRGKRNIAEQSREEAWTRGKQGSKLRSVKSIAGHDQILDAGFCPDPPACLSPKSGDRQQDESEVRVWARTSPENVDGSPLTARTPGGQRVCGQWIGYGRWPGPGSRGHEGRDRRANRRAG